MPFQCHSLLVCVFLYSIDLWYIFDNYSRPYALCYYTLPIEEVFVYLVE